VIQREPDPDADILDRMELAPPYWDGSFDFAYNTSRATDDTLGMSLGLNLERERGPSLLRIRTSGRFGKQKDRGEDERTNENQLLGEISQKYDIADRWFVQGSFDAMDDEVESHSLRSVPKLGVGYELYDTEDLTVSIAAGPAYVYQRYFGGSTEDYAALGFAAESEWDLPWADAVWYTRLGYTPSVTDWTTDYLVRGETWLEIPLAGPFAFKASILNIYNNSPADGTDRNSLNTSLGLSAEF
jgi:putative salt-induced outer membrane protein YdiY